MVLRRFQIISGALLSLYAVLIFYSQYIHNHHNPLHEVDTCPAYIISLLHHSDSPDLKINQDYCFAVDTIIRDNLFKTIHSRHKYITDFTRAPPA